MLLKDMQSNKERILLIRQIHDDYTIEINPYVVDNIYFDYKYCHEKCTDHNDPLCTWSIHLLRKDKKDVLGVIVKGFQYDDIHNIFPLDSLSEEEQFFYKMSGELPREETT